jgi:hypothetical protein
MKFIVATAAPKARKDTSRAPTPRRGSRQRDGNMGGLRFLGTPEDEPAAA